MRRYQAGLPDLPPDLAGRRRTSGLRREEVAAAAGVSVDYYTRLEQGRERNPSSSVLSALAKVLNLDHDATDHLFKLRDSSQPRAQVAHHFDRNEPAARMATLVGAVRPNPAYVLDRLSNVIAANAEGLTLFGGLADYPPETRNTCRYLLTHPRAREIFADWETIARGSVAQLRAANVANLADPELTSLVRDLSAHSTEFSDWWAEHAVGKRRSSEKRFRDGNGATTVHPYEVLHLPEVRMRMTLYLPPVDE